MLVGNSNFNWESGMLWIFKKKNNLTTFIKIWEKMKKALLKISSFKVVKKPVPKTDFDCISFFIWFHFSFGWFFWDKTFMIHEVSNQFLSVFQTLFMKAHKYFILFFYWNDDTLSMFYKQRSVSSHPWSCQILYPCCLIFKGNFLPLLLNSPVALLTKKYFQVIYFVSIGSQGDLNVILHML